MIFSFDVDIFPYIRREKLVNIQNCFRIDIENQILGVLV